MPDDASRQVQGGPAQPMFLVNTSLPSTSGDPSGTQDVRITEATATVPVKETGAANMANGQVAASGSASTLVAARTTRRSVTIKNLDGLITVYIGVATVSAANGMELKAGQSISIDYTGLIQVIAASGTPAIAYLETYD